MNRLYVFILRVILSIAFAVILTRMFHPEQNIVFIAGIAAILLSVSYFLAYMREKGGKEKRK